MHKQSGRALAAGGKKIRECSFVIGATAILVLAGMVSSPTYDLPDLYAASATIDGNIGSVYRCLGVFRCARNRDS